MPASFSAPIDPYLKRISGVARTHSGCGYSRKPRSQPMYAPIAPSTTTTDASAFNQRCLRTGVAASVLIATSRSERLQELDQRRLLVVAQLGAVGPALVAGV